MRHKKRFLQWSIASSLWDSAKSMRRNPGQWYWGDEEPEEILTLEEAAKKWSVDFEIYSKEPACQFEEHFLFLGGRLVADEAAEYIDEYDEPKVIENGFSEWKFAI